MKLHRSSSQLCKKQILLDELIKKGRLLKIKIKTVAREERLYSTLLEQNVELLLSTEGARGKLLQTLGRGWSV